MCRLSYEKCACFVFLVILAVLSCSGFRIDNIAMTDVSKRNTSNSLNNSASIPHRTRHLRHRFCPEIDVSFKAYKAEVVAQAVMESRHNLTRNIYTAGFLVVDWLKHPLWKHQKSSGEHFMLNFSSPERGSSCEYEDVKSHHLVRAKLELTKEYILFLKSNGMHKYVAVYVPEIVKKQTLRAVRRVVNPKFRPKPLKNSSFANQAKRKIVCKARGFPIPIVYWKKDNETLFPNSHKNIRVIQKKKKSTKTLVLRNVTDADSGRYKCVVEGVDKTSFPKMKIQRTGEPCPEPYQGNYCMNGGTCFFLKEFNEMGCECPTGYTGQHCEEKTSDQSSSMYVSPSLYKCKIGLYTKYDRC